MRDLDLGYVGVTVDDRDPQAVFDAMLAAVQQELPGWVPRNASLEVQLLEAFATGAADWIYATNRTVGAMVEALVAIDGVERDEGAPGSGQVTLTFDGPLFAFTIAEGDQFVSADSAVFLLAVRDTPVSGSSVMVDVEESEPGAAGMLTAGAAMSPVVGIPRLSTCVLSTAVTGGRPREDDLSFITRASLRRRRISNSLVTAQDFADAALEDPRVGRATAIDRWDAVGGTAVDGHVTVVVYGHGAVLAAEVKDELTATIKAAALSILTVHVVDATRPTVAVTAGVTVAPGFVGADVEAACEDAISGWLAWNNAGFGQTVTPTAIEALLESVPGVSTALVTVPSGDVTSAAWALPAPGTITVTT